MWGGEGAGGVQAAPASASPPPHKGHARPRPYLRAASPRAALSLRTARHGRDWGTRQPPVSARLCSGPSARADAERPPVQSGSAEGSPGRGRGQRVGGGARRACLRDSKARRAWRGVATRVGGGAWRGPEDRAIRRCGGQPGRRPARWRPPGGWAVTYGCCAISWPPAAREAWAWLRSLQGGVSPAKLAGDGFTARNGCAVSGRGSLAPLCS